MPTLRGKLSRRLLLARVPAGWLLAVVLWLLLARISGLVRAGLTTLLLLAGVAAVLLRLLGLLAVVGLAERLLELLPGVAAPLLRLLTGCVGTVEL